MKRLLLLHIVALAAAGTARAETVHDVNAWVNVTALGTIAGPLIYHAEVQPRAAEDSGGVSQLLLRGALGLQATPRLQLYGGYVRVVQPMDGAADRFENRLFTQINWSLGEVAGGVLSTRTRIERRDLSNGRDTGWRVRQFVRYAHPLREGGKAKALVWVEPFVALNDTDWGARKGFDQVRTFVGLELPVAGKTTIEPGYMNQTINAANGVTRVNHILSLTLWVRK